MKRYSILLLILLIAGGSPKDSAKYGNVRCSGGAGTIACEAPLLPAVECPEGRPRLSCLTQEEMEEWLKAKRGEK